MYDPFCRATGALQIHFRHRPVTFLTWGCAVPGNAIHHFFASYTGMRQVYVKLDSIVNILVIFDVLHVVVIIILSLICIRVKKTRGAI